MIPDVATIDFLARGGDDYPFEGLEFTSVGVSYQQALANYIQQALGGTVTAADYPETSDRIFATAFDPTLPDFGGGSGGNDGSSGDPASVPEPGIVLGFLGAAALGSRLKRRRLSVPASK
ncbi:MAG: PEP-CTERM sorting domain-containing protein [Cyanobacteria bacterium P01_A01_bin.114]